MIHPTAIISPEVEMGSDVEVGPYSLIQGKVKIGSGTSIGSHVSIGMGLGAVEIGENNHIFPGCVIGAPPQDLSYKGEGTSLAIGSGNTFREHVTIHLGTLKGGGKTLVGNNNFIMGGGHIGHDAQVGHSVTLTNQVLLAGHVIVEDQAVLGGRAGVVQRIRVGRGSYIGANSCVTKDILPFSIARGPLSAVMIGTNRVGLKRGGAPKEELMLVNEALSLLIQGEDSVSDTIERIKKNCPPSDYIDYLIRFAQDSKNGLARKSGLTR